MTLNLLMYQWFQKFDKYSDGSYIHKVELSKNLADDGVKIHIITVGDLNLNHNNIICHNLHFTNKYILLALYFFVGFKLILSEKFDMIYCRHPAFGIFSLIFKKIKGYPVVYEVNGIRENSQNKANEHLKKFDIDNSAAKIGFGTGKLAVNIDNYVARSSDAIIAVTPKIASYIHERCRVPYDKLYVINNGANADLFKPIDINVCRNDLKFDKNRLYVCFVGSISPWHGIEYIIQAASNILEKERDVKFVIVGDGPLKNQYEKMVKNKGIEDSFIFVGEVPYNKVPLYINASDICIAPFTKAIGEHIGLSPLKIYEYLSCGKPVITSRFPDLDFIGKAHCGILTEPENVSEIENALIKLLESNELRSNMGTNGRTYVLENHTWKNVAKETKKIFTSLHIKDL